MNAELIKKYKKEFDYWLGGGPLLCRHLNYITQELTSWENIGESVWNLSVEDCFGIIIDDDYVGLRKALVEGEIIQVYDVILQHPDNPEFDIYGWRDFKSFKPCSQFTYEMSKYRIKPKPEATNFKIGDFVIVENEVGHIYTISKEDGTLCVYGKGWYNPDELELWEPKLGEWCWFHNGTPASLVFAKFYNLNDFGYWIDEDETEVITNSKFLNYRICEPFTGNLPTVLTSNQTEHNNE